jgi:hypothetical protein
VSTSEVDHLTYGFAAGVSHASFGVSPIRHSLHAGLSQLAPVLRDTVGTFESLTVHLPAAAYWIWWLLVLGAVAAALWLGTPRQRWVLISVVLIALAFPVLFYAWIYRFSGFGLQGRYVLPVIVLVPLLAGEILHQRLGTLAPSRFPNLLLGAAAALFAGFHAYAWWFNASESAGAPHTIRFYAHALWSRPLGMPPEPWTLDRLGLSGPAGRMWCPCPSRARRTRRSSVVRPSR